MEPTRTQNNTPCLHLKPTNGASIAPPKQVVMKPATDVIVVRKSQYKAAADCLAAAFAKDDVANYFLQCPDMAHWTIEQKWTLHVNILEYIVYAHCLKGLVLGIPSAGSRAVDDNEYQVQFDAVALWMPPGTNMDDILTILRSGMWRLNYQLSREGKARFFDEFLPLLHDTKHEIMGDRDSSSWYLVYIGAREAARGKGCARRLINYVTEKVSLFLRASLVSFFFVPLTNASLRVFSAVLFSFIIPCLY